MITLDRSFVAYVGLSTDDKPTDATPGAHFAETDTANEYVFDGDRWTPDAAAATATSAALDVLREIAETAADVRDEVRATRLGVQELLNEGGDVQVDLLELSLSLRDQADELEY